MHVHGLIAAAWLIAACGSVAGDDDAGDDVCAELTADCNGDPGDGCEADMTSALTCGSCDEFCGAPRQGTARCVDRRCEFECNDGLVPCGGECRPTCAATILDQPGQYPFAVPPGCERVRVAAWGAGGGNGGGNSLGAGSGHADAVIAVTGGETLTLVVGAPGLSANGGAAGAGGVPGGGAGGSSGTGLSGGGGGGFSGAFRGPVGVDTALVIAGGGGGSAGGDAAKVTAGAGGGEVAEGRDGAAGASQTTGYLPLIGGQGDSAVGGNRDGGGGGGAGWFGGMQGLAAEADGSGGGGGSGYAEPTATGVRLVTGAGPQPGGSDVLGRNSAGNPGTSGRVIADCVAE